MIALHPRNTSPEEEACDTAGGALKLQGRLRPIRGFAEEACSKLTTRVEKELPLSPWFRVLVCSRAQTSRSAGARALAY